MGVIAIKLTIQVNIIPGLEPSILTESSVGRGGEVNRVLVVYQGIRRMPREHVQTQNPRESEQVITRNAWLIRKL
jgi:hypothetical protein